MWANTPRILILVIFCGVVVTSAYEFDPGPEHGIDHDQSDIVEKSDLTIREPRQAGQNARRIARQQRRRERHRQRALLLSSGSDNGEIVQKTTRRGYRYTKPTTTTTTTTTTTERTTTASSRTRPPRPEAGVESYFENDSDFLTPSEEAPTVQPDRDLEFRPVDGTGAIVGQNVGLVGIGRGPNEYDIRDTIPGEPGVDYPVHSHIPKTSFRCEGRGLGYFADIETHWWINVECPGSEEYFKLNEEIGVLDNNGEYLKFSAMRHPPETNMKRVAPVIIPASERLQFQTPGQVPTGQSNVGQRPQAKISVSPTTFKQQTQYTTNNVEDQRLGNTYSVNNNNNNRRPSSTGQYYPSTTAALPFTNSDEQVNQLINELQSEDGNGDVGQFDYAGIALRSNIDEVRTNPNPDFIDDGDDNFYNNNNNDAQESDNDFNENNYDDDRDSEEDEPITTTTTTTRRPKKSKSNRNRNSRQNKRKSSNSNRKSSKSNNLANEKRNRISNRKNKLSKPKPTTTTTTEMPVNDDIDDDYDSEEYSDEDYGETDEVKGSDTRPAGLIVNRPPDRQSASSDVKVDEKPLKEPQSELEGPELDFSPPPSKKEDTIPDEYLPPTKNATTTTTTTTTEKPKDEYLPPSKDVPTTKPKYGPPKPLSPSYGPPPPLTLSDIIKDRDYLPPNKEAITDGEYLPPNKEANGKSLNDGGYSNNFKPNMFYGSPEAGGYPSFSSALSSKYILGSNNNNNNNNYNANVQNNNNNNGGYNNNNNNANNFDFIKSEGYSLSNSNDGYQNQNPQQQQQQQNFFSGPSNLYNNPNQQQQQYGFPNQNQQQQQGYSDNYPRNTVQNQNSNPIQSQFFSAQQEINQNYGYQNPSNQQQGYSGSQPVFQSSNTNAYFSPTTRQPSINYGVSSPSSSNRFLPPGTDLFGGKLENNYGSSNLQSSYSHSSNFVPNTNVYSVNSPILQLPAL